MWLRLDDCPQPKLNPSEAYAALRLELGQAGMRVVGDAEREHASAELTVQLRCDAGIHALLRLRPRSDRSSASRLVPLDDTSPKDRARVLALALTELVRTDWSELVRPAAVTRESGADEKPSPAAAPVAEASAPASPTASGAKPEPSVTSDSTARDTDERDASRNAASADRPDDNWRWQAQALTRWFTAAPQLMVGPAFELGHGRLAAGLEAALGRSSSARGVANYGLAAATLSFDAFATHGANARVALGPKLALGATWATGQSTLANIQSSDVVQLYADARVECRLTLHTRALDVGLRLAAGRANGLKLQDRQRNLGATGGWFLGAALGAGW